MNHKVGEHPCSHACSAFGKPKCSHDDDDAQVVDKGIQNVSN